MKHPRGDAPATDRIKIYPFWCSTKVEPPKLAPGRELTLEHTADAPIWPEVIVPGDGLDVVAVYVGADQQYFLPAELPMRVHGTVGTTLRGFLLTPGDRSMPCVQTGQRFAVVVRNVCPEGTADVPVVVGVLGNASELFTSSKRVSSASQ